MIKVTTESGSVYEFYPDTHNWKRYRGEGASDIGFDTGVYSHLECKVGERMRFWSDTSNYIDRPCRVTATTVMSIE